VAGRGIRKIGGSGRLQARRATGGFSLLEVTLSITVLLVALLAATASTLKMAGLRRVNRERMLAQNAVRAVSERLQSLADRATTDPAGWTTAVLDGVAAGGEIGTTFDVRELTARDGAASVGTIQIVTDETITDAALGTQLGLPRDLDGDGAAGSSDVSNTARLLPVVVRAQWRGSSGNSQITHAFFLARF